MEYAVVIETVIVLFLLLGVGYVCGRFGIVSEHASKDLTRILMDVALPCMVFTAMVREYDAELMKSGFWMIGISFAMIFLGWGISFVLRKLFRVPNSKKGVWIFLSAFPNSGFMGYPIANAIFGSEGLFLAVMMNIATHICTYTIGIKTIGLDAEGSRKMQWSHILKSNANIGIALGLLFFFAQIPVPAPIFTTLGYLGDLTLPLSLFVVGLTLARGRFRDVVKNKDAFSASFMRLIIGPLTIFGLVSLLPIPEGSLMFGVAVLIAAMPCAALSLVFAEEYDVDSDTAGSGIFISSLLCVLTIPLMMLLV